MLGVLETLKRDFDAAAGGGKRISLADLIVLAGGAAVEAAAKAGGHAVEMPFTPGRTDASVLEPVPTASATSGRRASPLRPRRC